MNKSEFVSAVVARHPKDFPSRAAAERTIDSVIAVISSTLENCDSITLSGFGTFKVVQREIRMCRNVQTGAPIEVPAHFAPKFVPAKSLKDRVAK